MLNDIQGFLFDLDGVLCIDNDPIDGAIEVINELQSKRVPFRIVTNYTILSRKRLHSKLINIGFDIEENHIISAAYAGVLWLRKLNNPTCQFYLNKDSIEDYQEFLIDDQNPDYIIIGDLDDQWSFQIVNDIFNKVINGSKIIALHKGRYFQVKNGLQIDSGAFVKGIEYATSTTSKVIGKPEKEFFKIAIDDIGVSPTNLMMVGDDVINDIGGAKKIGVVSTLVRTGKYRQDLFEASGVMPDHIINSIKDLLDHLR